MAQRFSRRGFISLAASGLLLSSNSLSTVAAPTVRPRIRTITAGVQLDRHVALAQVEGAVNFLQSARREFEERGYEVQTLRIATQPLSLYLPQWQRESSFQALERLDKLAADTGTIISLGPVASSPDSSADFAAWASELIARTSTLSFTRSVASASTGVDQGAIAEAARAMASIAHSSPGGEGNFRFAATAFCPPGTPFFPAAYYETPLAFSIGLETPALMLEALTGVQDMATAGKALQAHMDAALTSVEAVAHRLQVQHKRHYLGIDTSPAPGLDASIGAVIERMTGSAFGSPSTLTACAAITSVLKGLQVRTCGYSGLMLPVLEDRVLARRAVEGRYGISELLLYSSVCGTGLDVVPLAGDIAVGKLSALIGDTAALANRYRKPLSARLFPVPGKLAGDLVSFENPFLTDSVIMSA
jgi:uncharacterized protein (UPF0210 family)